MNMGDAGRIMKRYLLHDPFNPVSRRDLLGLWPELLKFGLFYMTLFSIIVTLGRSSRGRQGLTVGTLAMLPVLGFAIHWSGGDLERYLPLYPAFFLMLSISLTDQKALSLAKTIAWLFVLCVVFPNAVSLRSAAVQHFQTQAENRVIRLLPRLKPGSCIIVSHNLDDLMEFNRNFPFSSINRLDALHIYGLLTPGDSDVTRWHESFASRALITWLAGGDMWISSRVLHRTPYPDWNWVEGDDNRVSWSDLESFFSHLQYGESLGGDDGFVLLLPSTENRKLLGVLKPKESILLPASAQLPSVWPRGMLLSVAHEPISVNSRFATF